MSSQTAQSWGKWVALAMALHALYSMFNAKQRNLIYGEFYKFRFMMRRGYPASVRTAFLACVLWSLGFLSFLYPNFWEWDYSGVLFLAGYATVMLSSYIDARSCRARVWG